MKSFFQRFKTSKIERIGDDFYFLRRKYKLEVEVDGFWIQPGDYIQQMLKAYEDQIGPVKSQQLPADNSGMREPEKISLVRGVVGSGIYLCQERYDVALTVKELKNVKSYSFAILSLEEILRILEEDYGLLPSA